MIKLCGNWFINMAVEVDSDQQIATYTCVTMATYSMYIVHWTGPVVSGCMCKQHNYYPTAILLKKENAVFNAFH